MLSATQEIEQIRLIQQQQRDENTRLRSELSARDRTTVATEFKLPQELKEVLKGDTLEEMRAHARKLAGAAGLFPKAPPTEAGNSPAVAAAVETVKAESATYGFNAGPTVKW